MDRVGHVSCVKTDGVLVWKGERVRRGQTVSRGAQEHIQQVGCMDCEDTRTSMQRWLGDKGREAGTEKILCNFFLRGMTVARWKQTAVWE